MNYPKFRAEIKNHASHGYHNLIVKYQRSDIENFCKRKKWKIPLDYMDFLTSIGSGIFFAGSLVIFPWTERNGMNVDSVTEKISIMGAANKIVFGCDGTTDGVFCLSQFECDDKVYWFEWADGNIKVEAENFFEWIESKPKELFSAHIYAGFKKIKDVKGVNEIIEKRKKFTITLERFDRELTRPPEKTDDFLPRYNKLYLNVVKHENVELDLFTIKCQRTGSSVGNNNYEYVTIDVSEIPVLKPSHVTCWIFDPFNLPFENIVVDSDPYIDLSSKMRIKYKEIKKYL